MKNDPDAIDCKVQYVVEFYSFQGNCNLVYNFLAAIGKTPKVIDYMEENAFITYRINLDYVSHRMLADFCEKMNIGVDHEE